MYSSHFYVRRIKAPNEVLQHGYSDFSGQFDPTEFEQVEGRLPDGYLLINHTDLISSSNGLRTKTLIERLLGRK